MQSYKIGGDEATSKGETQANAPSKGAEKSKSARLRKNQAAGRNNAETRRKNATYEHDDLHKPKNPRYREVINYATHFSETERRHNDELHIMEVLQIEEIINNVIGEDGKKLTWKKAKQLPKDDFNKWDEAYNTELRRILEETDTGREIEWGTTKDAKPIPYCTPILLVYGGWR